MILILYQEIWQKTTAPRRGRMVLHIRKRTPPCGERIMKPLWITGCRLREMLECMMLHGGADLEEIYINTQVPMAA